MEEWRLSDHSVEFALTSSHMWLTEAKRSLTRTEHGAVAWELLLGSLAFVHALHHIRVCVQMAARNAAPAAAAAVMVDALADFDKTVPGITEVRNAIEHVDEYVLGTGDLQQKGTNRRARVKDETAAQAWRFQVERVGSPERVRVNVADHVFDLEAAYAAAVQLRWDFYRGARIHAGDAPL